MIPKLSRIRKYGESFGITILRSRWGEVSSDFFGLFARVVIFEYFQTPIWGSRTPNLPFWSLFLFFYEVSESLFRTEGRLTAPFACRSRAARWARGQQMCVPPARKERNGVPMIGRMGGGAKGTHPSAFKPPRAPRRPRRAHAHPKSHPFRSAPAFSSPPLPTLARALTFAICPSLALESAQDALARRFTSMTSPPSATRLSSRPPASSAPGWSET